MSEYNNLDILKIESLALVSEALKKHNCNLALFKKLSRNNNDKNQIYFHHDASILNSVFDMTFEERAASTSTAKRSSSPGKTIPQAVFNNFYWLSQEGNLERAKSCKAITYHQYPETRLSGFQTVNGEMPRAMTVDYTKREDALPRYLVIGATPTGHAVAMMLVNPERQFVEEYLKLEGYQGSKICKYVTIQTLKNSNTSKLKKLLTNKIANRSLKGCRFDKDGTTLPFVSTQVHGYTLEHACGIKPNSDHDGDIYGIELKCFRSNKLSLITTEADGGLYNESFSDFMKSYGYLKGDDYRLTGVHRANIFNPKTELTLKIICYPLVKGQIEIKKMLYDPIKPFAKQMNGMSVVLEDKEENTAASWSIEHLMNRWGAKHNEVVYVPATVVENEVASEIEEGYLKRVIFEDKVLWCFRSTVENLIKAIHSGIIFLDPAPKYNENNAKTNKRRTQWRLNNIYKAVPTLYEKSEIVEL